MQLTTKQFYDNRLRMVNDILKYIDEYNIDISPRDATEYKENIKSELYNFYEIQRLYCERVEKNKAIKELKAELQNIQK